MITRATKITLARLFLVPVLVVIALVDFKSHFLVAALLYVLIAVTDSLDGYVARKTNTVSKLGKLLDPLADKALSLATMLCALISGLLIPIEAAICAVVLIFIREIGITVMRQVLLKKGKVLGADKFGKVKTIFINTSLPVIYLAASHKYDFGYDGIGYEIIYYLGLSIFAIGFALTVFSGVRYIIINRKLLSGKDVSSSEVENSENSINVLENAENVEIKEVNDENDTK